MSTDTEAHNYTKAILEFKSTSFSSPVLVVFSTEINQIELQLNEKIAQAPEFFKNSPLLIDLKNCNNEEQGIDLTALIKCLRGKKIFPIGISGGNDEQNKQAIKCHIPTHTLRATNSINDSSPKKVILENNEASVDKPPPEPITPSVVNMLISHPVRSGQRIYAKGDLTILSHVSAGAEIMAEGNIHVYGALRGRALAGVQGDINSRIFCSDLQAELISIAGHYKISEELEETEHPMPTQVFLQNKALIIKKL